MGGETQANESQNLEKTTTKGLEGEKRERIWVCANLAHRPNCGRKEREEGAEKQEGMKWERRHRLSIF